MEGKNFPPILFATVLRGMSPLCTLLPLSPSLSPACRCSCPHCPEGEESSRTQFCQAALELGSTWDSSSRSGGRWISLSLLWGWAQPGTVAASRGGGWILYPCLVSRVFPTRLGGETCPPPSLVLLSWVEPGLCAAQLEQLCSYPHSQVSGDSGSGRLEGKVRAYPYVGKRTGSREE